MGGGAWRRKSGGSHRATPDERGCQTLHVGRSRRSKSSLVNASEGEAGGEAVEVTTARLDDLALEGFFDPAEVGFLWLDVEGYECRVLQGASSVLERSP